MFPSMLDQYQISLTRMLEAERYDEAKRLLRFLLQCQGQEKQHYEEWDSLLGWLDVAFPENGQEAEYGEGDEEELREQALQPARQDRDYINGVLHVMEHHPMIDQRMLALERAAYIESDEVHHRIRTMLADKQLHPVLQFKALQCLKKRGESGEITVERLGEEVKLRIEETPLSIDEFPSPILRILERTSEAVEVDDPTLPHFAQELWKESLQFLYGTSSYQWMLREDDGAIDCFAAALHLTLLLTVYGSANDDDIRDAYGITEALRFQYEQACRSLRGIASLLQQEDEPQP
ncbi:hypothetical protein [Paenibacillus sp. J5C2022]|uniref:hypothetical protein n=1 Tax=Paenibacillus sp. J5C2022 TaxID=2977129 RepID=UPI0021D07DB3|nr:hypothetical protein [Paenibacillus sp. J5C2022]